MLSTSLPFYSQTEYIDLKPDHKIYPDELEDIFYESLDKDFNTHAEDGSVEQVNYTFIFN